jgi:hypothetical protein
MDGLWRSPPADFQSSQRDLFWNRFSRERCRKEWLSFALYQGTTLVVPQKAKRNLGFSPCAFWPPGAHEKTNKQTDLSCGNHERIDDQGLDRCLRQNLWHADIGITAGRYVNKHHIGRVFGAGSADVQLPNCFDCNSCQQKSVRYLKPG